MAPSVAGCCARCWASHRQCFSVSVTRPCRHCSRPSLDASKSSAGDQLPARVSLPFPRSAMVNHYHAQNQPDWNLSVDTHGLDTIEWKLLFTRLSGQGLDNIHVTFESYGYFSTFNETLVPMVDEEIRRAFSADLRPMDKNSEMIADAALAGGYAHCFCSIVQTSESVETFVDGINKGSSDSGGAVAATFRHLVFCRLGELVERLMSSIRHQTENGTSSELCAGIYAAAVILHKEIDHIQGEFRHGSRRSLIPDSIPAEVLDWFISLEHELADYVKDGCGQFLNWRSPIKGSMKKFRDKRHGETLKVAIHLQHNTYSNVFDQACFVGSPGYSDDEGSQSPSHIAYVEGTLPTQSNSYKLSSNILHDSTMAIADQPCYLSPQVPPLYSATSGHNIGQMSSSLPFSAAVDSDPFFGNDVLMTSLDSQIVSDNRMTSSVSFLSDVVLN